MPHIRHRYILEPFKVLKNFSRILGVVGHRQVGKSTFTESVAKEYVTLDDEDTIRRAKRSPKEFIGSLRGNLSAIDECQMVPGLFSALKLKVGTSKKPGQYILTGSIRFSSRTAIRESLTGRIVNLELLPMVCSELAQEPLSDAVLRLIQASNFKAQVYTMSGHKDVVARRNHLIDKYLKNGGLPGVCFVRNSKTQQALAKEILDTILDRDIRLVYPTTVAFDQIKSLCAYLAENSRHQFSLVAAQRYTQLSVGTIKKILNAMESIFLIRRIPVLGDYKGELFWFEDQLEKACVARTDTIADSDWTELLYRNIRAQFTYRVGEVANYFSYQTRGGAFVPLVISTESGYLGIIPVKNENAVSRSQIASAESFIKKYQKSSVVFALQEGFKASSLTERMAKVPLSSLIFCN